MRVEIFVLIGSEWTRIGIDNVFVIPGTSKGAVGIK
jgi:hypothetical protein